MAWCSRTRRPSSASSQRTTSSCGCSYKSSSQPVNSGIDLAAQRFHLGAQAQHLLVLHEKHGEQEGIHGQRVAGIGGSGQVLAGRGEQLVERDRKSTRLNSSHQKISYAVFCLKKK